MIFPLENNNSLSKVLISDLESLLSAIFWALTMHIRMYVYKILKAHIVSEVLRLQKISDRVISLSHIRMLCK